MATTRRDFLWQTALGSAALSLPKSLAQGREQDEVPTPDEMLDLLILGGTGFLGPHIVDAAIARGHTMTLFNRGRTNPQLFPDLEKLEGDRDPEKDEGLTALEGRRWDAVIDTSGYVPRIAKASAELLKDAVKQYVFISTVSVYPEEAFSEPGVNEETPLATVADETTEEVTGVTYGALKALCENAVQQTMPGRSTIIRPGLIVGPGDPTDRFTYWPVRIDRGGEVLAPEPRDLSVQYIDARDLASFVIQAIEHATTGVLNALGPRGPLNMAEFLYGCKAVTSTPVDFVWVDADFLVEQQVGPWMELPLWIPGEEMCGFGQVSNDRALKARMTFRPLADTARDTIAWHKEKAGADYVFGRTPGRGGLDPDKERRILEAWQQRSKE